MAWAALIWVGVARLFMLMEGFSEMGALAARSERSAGMKIKDE